MYSFNNFCPFCSFCPISRFRQHLLTKCWQNFSDQKEGVFSFLTPCRMSSYDVSLRRYQIFNIWQNWSFWPVLTYFWSKNNFWTKNRQKQVKLTTVSPPPVGLGFSSPNFESSPSPSSRGFFTMQITRKILAGMDSDSDPDVAPWAIKFVCSFEGVSEFILLWAQYNDY